MALNHVFNRSFIKFWSVDASTFASHYQPFSEWLNSRITGISLSDPSSYENAYPVYDASDNSFAGYKLTNTRSRNYPSIAGMLNSDNMFFIPDLRFMYVEGICYDCNNIGVTDVSVASGIGNIQFDSDSGLLLLPETLVNGIQGIQGSAGQNGIQGLQGAQGYGIQGLQGSIGKDGLQGFQGLQGAQGIPGLPSSTTANPLSIQGIDGTYYDFNGSQRTIITGIYTLQGYLQNISKPDGGDYVLKDTYNTDMLKINNGISAIDSSLEWNEMNGSPTGEFVNFKRGSLSDYQAGISGSDSSSFMNSVFFDSSSHMIYMNGESYTASAGADVRLDSSAFVKAERFSDISSGKQYIVFYNIDDASIYTVEISGVNTLTPSLDVSLDLNSGNYDIDINLDHTDNGNIIRKNNQGLTAHIELQKNASGQLYLSDYEGNAIGPPVDISTGATGTVFNDVSIMENPVDISGNIRSGWNIVFSETADSSADRIYLNIDELMNSAVTGMETDLWDSSIDTQNHKTLWGLKNYTDASINGLSGIEKNALSGTSVVIDSSQQHGIVTQTKTVLGNLKLGGMQDTVVDMTEGIVDENNLNTAVKKIKTALEWDDLSDDSAVLCRFIKGEQSKYVTSADGVTYTLVEDFKSSFPDWQYVVYFATDTQTLWMNGKPYGISGQSLQFMSTVVTSVKKEGNELIFTTYDSQNTTNKTSTFSVQLTTISAIPNSPIVVTPPDSSGSDNDYQLDIRLDGLTIGKNSQNALENIVRLKESADGNSLYLSDVNGTQIGNSIDMSVFMKDNYLADALLTNTDASGNNGRFLKLIMYQRTSLDSSSEYKNFYIPLNEFLNIYTGGSGIKILSGNDSSVISLNIADSSYIGLNSSGVLTDSSLADKIISIDTNIQDVSVRLVQNIETANTNVIELLRGDSSNSWLDSSSSTQTLWSVKNYTDSALDSSMESLRNSLDSSIDSSVNGYKGVFTHICEKDGLLDPTVSEMESVGSLKLGTYSDENSGTGMDSADELNDSDSINQALSKIANSMTWFEA